MTLRPFRFGIQAATAASRVRWQSLARRTEELGYDVLTMPDHFTDQLAPVPALMSAADATTNLRIGALVLDNDYKHPVVLAKELATMDVLCDGRLEIGLGAGWMVSDYERSGIAYDPPKVRIDRFQEALSIIREAMGDGPFSADGEHYRISGYEGFPKPLQRPHPPILIGGGGPRVLRLAARHADVVGVNANLAAGEVGRGAYESMSAEAVDAKIATIREAAGERIGSIELNVRVFMAQITDDRSQALAAIAAVTGVTPEDVGRSPYALVGTTSQIVDDLVARRERWGFSYIVVGVEMLDAFAPVVAELAGR